MGTLEYDIQTARLHAEIDVLKKAMITYQNTPDLEYIKGRLDRKEHKLAKLFKDNIPF